MKKMERRGGYDRYIVLCLFLSFPILFIYGIKMPSISAALGMAFCILGFLKGSVKVDLWIFIPLVIYNILSVVSSYVLNQDIFEGYASSQVMLPVIYLLAAHLDDRDLKLLRRMLVILAGITALFGICEFLYTAMTNGAIRLAGIMGNPNALGIFMAISYFALMSCVPESGKSRRFWICLEPVFLIIMALTMSMGSLTALAVGMLVLMISKFRKEGFRNAFFRACKMTAKAVMGLGLGFLLYITAVRTEIPVICIPILIYIVFFILSWEAFGEFLENYKRMSVLIAFLSLFLVIVALIIRPNSVETLVERFEMMKSGIHYMSGNPVLGVGPYNWRQLNFMDSDKYFNVNHIHNAFIHAGAELGIPAMLMLIAAAVRIFIKKKSTACRASGAAFVFHNMIDAVFFNIKITLFALMAISEPREDGKILSPTVSKIIFAIFGVIYTYYFYWCVVT